MTEPTDPPNQAIKTLTGIERGLATGGAIEGVHGLNPTRMVVDEKQAAYDPRTHTADGRRINQAGAAGSIGQIPKYADLGSQQSDRRTMAAGQPMRAPMPTPERNEDHGHAEFLAGVVQSKQPAPPMNDELRAALTKMMYEVEIHVAILIGACKSAGAMGGVLPDQRSVALANTHFEDAFLRLKSILR